MVALPGLVPLWEASTFSSCSVVLESMVSSMEFVLVDGSMLGDELVHHSGDRDIALQSCPDHQLMILADPGASQDLLRQDGVRQLQLVIEVDEHGVPGPPAKEEARHRLACLASQHPSGLGSCIVQLSCILLSSRAEGLVERVHQQLMAIWLGQFGRIKLPCHLKSLTT